ncbi:sensor histidine kinase [Streptomyces avicenniae]|uniref:sensor histidine kinase n=1 Tax=Streptomyces avicenniae TaxID=500153 RepID=UPI00069CADDC|nr:histidine kinase [Streptomyces avicenniae]
MIRDVWRVLQSWPRARDAFPALVVVAVAVPVSMAGTSGAWHAPREGVVAWTALACVPLVWRSLLPWQVTGAALALEYAHVLAVPEDGLLPGASLVALFTAASHSSRRVAWSAGVALATATTLLLALARSEPVLTSGGVLVFDLLVLATALGDTSRSRRAYVAALRERAERAEQTRALEAARRVTQERMRIARDLHDVVAHHITLVNAQAGVARHLFRSDPQAAYLALEQVQDTSRAALDELRATVGLLRQDGDRPDPRTPTPGLADLEELAGSFRHTGLPVTVTRTGASRPSAPSVDLAAYRIIQEALTNVAKHAGPATAHVRLDYAEETLRVTVTDTGRGPLTSTGGGGAGGHGLIGMRERAAAFGGRLTTGPARPHGFRVEADLPLPPAPAAEAVR